MARATAHPNHNFISSEDVHWTEVCGAEDRRDTAELFLMGRTGPHQCIRLSSRDTAAGV